MPKSDVIMSSPYVVLITGANGFIGKNLSVHLKEISNYTVLTFVRGDSLDKLLELVAKSDAIVHLAGENRPEDVTQFDQVNTGLTVALCNAIAYELRESGRHNIPLLFASSTQAELDTPYGRSKLAAEEAVQALADTTGNPCMVFRLPGVFGKWCKPNYNSVVATFCNNIARGLSIQIDDPSATVRLVYVDDVVTAIVTALENPAIGFSQVEVQPEYTVTVGLLAAQIRAFGECRTTLHTERVGTGFLRALYATYVSYLPKNRFSYELEQYSDRRGVFVEMLKTQDSGQFSYFTAHAGVTRGGHYHHTKSEKFLVIKGEALFRFRHLLTGELVELHTCGDKPEVVDTMPGWVHDITNVGTDEMVVMLWANENFDRERPDTVAMEV
jgi:UDP-2-acetamido-2,6-beta-L-arabino-hexul-4-ose reductase